MLLNYNLLPDHLQKGIFALESYGFVNCGKQGIPVTALPGDEVCIEKSDQDLVITYDTVPHFYMALARSIGMENGTHTITPKVKDLGLMLDCSRNAVPKPDMIKQLICLLVLTGYNYLELYTEETYELPDEPYFGYMRGRYTAEELKEIVAFADIFQFEMVPCIQALAHLGRLAYWATYLEYMDINDILLAGDDKTYALIRKCLKFCKGIFHTKRINIGTDEAFLLGHGKYLDKFGHKSKHEIYLEHLAKVFEICKEEGFEPEFWADAFYDTECSTEDIQKIFDGTQVPVYWEYYGTEKEPHAEKMEKLKEYAGQVKFAGGAIKWIGYAPDNAHSNRVTKAALEAAAECNVDDILMTAWGDNGNECSVYATIPSIWYAAELIYPCEVDSDKIVADLTGYTITEWQISDQLNHVMPGVDKIAPAAKYLLHNDFLIGLMDYHTPDHAGKIYEELLPAFDILAKRNSQFAYIFESYATLCNALIKKSTYTKRLYSAYQNNDEDTMKALLKELSEIKLDLQKFYDAFRTLWLKENKGFGMEIMDVRIGGLITRIDTVSVILSDYLKGRIEKIYELEEKRLPLDMGEHLTGDEIFAPLHNHWLTSYSINCI